MKQNTFHYLAALIIFACFASNAAGQTSRSTGTNYFGADLGLTYNWYSGGSNFIWPITQNIGIDPNTDAPGSIASFAKMNSLGSGVGFILGAKVGFALSNSVDIEGKLKFITNYTSSSETNDSIPITLTNPDGTKFTQIEPVNNDYNLLLSNLDLDVLAHIGLGNTFYAAGGFGFSSLLSNRLYVHQIKNGGTPWTYFDQATSAPNQTNSPDTEITMNNVSLSNFFSSSRLGLLLGGGAVFPLAGSTELDAELLLSIPFTPWLQSDAETAGLTTSTPKLWYASLTVGIRFPFGGSSESSAPTSTSSSDEGTKPKSNIGPDGKVALTGRVTDAKTGDPLSANMTVVDLTNNQVVATDKTDADGNYNVRVLAPGKYSVTADADGHLFGTAYFEVDPEGRILSKHPDIKLGEASGRTRLLVFFDFGASSMNSSSYPELDRAVRLMKAVPSMKVEIAGYTDNVGDADFNIGLSEKRANAVRDYLVSKGIAKNRVTTHGYGMDSPIADNSTDDGRAENRRVEFVVLSK